MSFGQTTSGQEVLKDIKEFDQGYNWTILGLLIFLLLSFLIYSFLFFLKKYRSNRSSSVKVSLRDKFNALSEIRDDELFIEKVREIFIRHHFESFDADISAKTENELMKFLDNPKLPLDYRECAMHIVRALVDVRFRPRVKEIERKTYLDAMENLLRITKEQKKTEDKSVSI